MKSPMEQKIPGISKFPGKGKPPEIVQNFRSKIAVPLDSVLEFPEILLLVEWIAPFVYTVMQI